MGTVDICCNFRHGNKKKQLWVFLAMFAVPEILWNPVVNILYSFFQSGKINPNIFRNSFLLEYKYEPLLKFFIIVQFIGIMLTMFYIIKYRKNIKNLIFWPLVLICSVSVIIQAFAFYLMILFNPSFP